MIKFFRKLRYNLIEQNKTSKYFKYAIGEIILVVIGILIALQINTWKDDAKNKEVELSYLEGIRNNLDQDIYDLNELIGKDTLKFGMYTTLLRSFTDKNINKYSGGFIYAIGQSYVTHTFNGNSIVFEDMKSSGKINFIQSDVVRFSILEYYNESQKNIRYQNEQYLDEFNELKRNAFHDNIDLNSLIEDFMFDKRWNASLDQLDLSFFDADINSDKVKKFANRLSVMKVLLQNNHRNNLDLVFKAERLREKITKYISKEVIDENTYISKETLTAIKNGDIARLQQTIEINKINNCFETEFETSTYLTIAIHERSLKSLKFFIAQGADVEKVCENKTPLMYAVKYGLMEMIEYLIEQGANVNFVSVKGKTALDYAIQYEQENIISYLQKQNAKQVKTLGND
mgnify:CR=1 FL=1|tara:strand:+ start:11552 stop:12754 length:1203 start_codon:yes stop_codon:yes gene_type:complete